MLRNSQWKAWTGLGCTLLAGLLVASAAKAMSREASLRAWGGGTLPIEARLSAPTRTAEFEALIACRTVLAELEWSWREWPASNPTPKPSRADGLPDAEIRRQTDELLRKEAALTALYRVELDGRALQTEMHRIAINTRGPDRLRAQFEALQNDTEAVANCIARPLLIERRLREGYTHDARWHGDLRRRAEAALAAGASAAELAASGGREQTITLLRDTSEQPARDPAAIEPGELRLSADEFARERARLLPEPSRPDTAPASPRPPTGLRETAEAYVEETVLSHSADRLVVRSRIWSKQPFDVWWTARRADHEPAAGWTSAALTLPPVQGRGMAPEAAADSWKVFDIPSERAYHSAVWTGIEMIIWGGYDDDNLLSTGSRYNPTTDSWRSTALVDAPVSRGWHTAIWTGNEMIVWGGNSGSHTVASGGRYDPVMDRWTETSITDATPSARTEHTAVWTGSEMIVWGGFGDTGSLETGGRYNPSTNNWVATSSIGAPSARGFHLAAWTGREMIIHGGGLNTGGRYDPLENRWTPTNTSGAPNPCGGGSQTAVWTGVEMIVWGGFCDFSTGGSRYNPVTDRWMAMSNSGMPNTRARHTAVWTGNEMIIWGGTQASNHGRYNPETDQWRLISNLGAPTVREYHTAVWTGSEMIVWGGLDSSGLVSSGGRYSPSTDSWVATANRSPPSPRSSHTAIWTGSEMLVWGGTSRTTRLSTGGRYQPATDNWIATSSIGAPSARYLHTALWTGSEMIVWGGVTGESDNINTGGRYDQILDRWSATAVNGAPTARSAHTAIWTGDEMIVWGGNSGSVIFEDGARYDPEINQWVPTAGGDSAPRARVGHTAVWTGTEMVIWGGSVDDGYRYTPTMDRWDRIADINSPAPRFWHTAIWSGTEMLVWGGLDNNGRLNSGGRYDPVRNRWSPISLINVPTPRFDHSAVWTGRDMIIWGGTGGEPTTNSTGGTYDPATNRWLVTTTINAPTARRSHTAVWNGREMIVFGGAQGINAPLAELGMYRPYATDTTTTTITAATPDPSIPGQSVTIDIAVVGASIRPTVGQVTVNATTGESCTDTTATAGGGTTARYACAITFATTGSRSLTAVYSGSGTHDPSVSPAELHEVVALPSVRVEVAPASVEEDAGTPLVYTLTRSVSLPSPTVVQLATSGTATAGVDYPSAAANITIPAGATTATLSVTPAADFDVESDETVILSVAAGSGYTAGSPASATGTILNDDQQQPTTTTITADLPDPSVVGQPYPVSVEVRGQGLSPLGSVTISDGSGASCSGPLTTGAAPLSTMSCTLVSTSAGSKLLTASYAPANGQFASSSDTEAHTVDPAATSLTLSGPASVRINTAASYTATLTVTAPGGGTPAGTVTVSAGAQSCTITLPSSTPSCTLSYATPGSRAVTAVYVPANGNHLGATATPLQTLAFASADLAIAKSNGIDVYLPNDLLLYTVEVENRGPDTAAGLRILDPVPAGLGNVAWTCAAQSGGAICPGASGSGGLDVSPAPLPPGGRLLFTYRGTVQGRPTQIVNVASVVLPADGTVVDPVPGNNGATDTDRLDFMLADGFEAPLVNGPSGALQVPTGKNQGLRDGMVRPLLALTDRHGMAARVYARHIDGEVEYALAQRGSDDVLDLGDWQRMEPVPTLRWVATADSGGWRVVNVILD